MSKPTIYLIDTTDGPRLVRADTLRLARRYVVETYIHGESRRATADDLAKINAEAKGLVIEDAGELGAIGDSHDDLGGRA